MNCRIQARATPSEAAPKAEAAATANAEAAAAPKAEASASPAAPAKVKFKTFPALSAIYSGELSLSINSFFQHNLPAFV